MAAAAGMTATIAATLDESMHKLKDKSMIKKTKVRHYAKLKCFPVSFVFRSALVRPGGWRWMWAG